MKIQGLDFPDDCPKHCRYRGSFAQQGQSAICGRCPVFCCKLADGFRLIEPEDFRPDWLVEWHQFFKTGAQPFLRLNVEVKDEQKR